MTLGELFIKIGFKPDTDQLRNVQSKVTAAVAAVNSKTGMFQKAGAMVADGMKKAANGVAGFFASIKSSAINVGNFIGDLKAVHFEIIGLGAAIVGITKKASDYAAELLRFNSVTGISTQALQALQQQAALAGVEADEINGTLKQLQQTSLDIQMGRKDGSALTMLGIAPDQDPIKLLDQIGKKLKGMSPARGSLFANELGLSDKMISFVKEAQSLGSSDKSLLLSDKEIKKLKEFNIYFNRAWDSSKRALQRLGVTLIPVATQIVNAFERMVKAAKTIGDFFTWFSDNFKGITKALLIFAGVVGVVLFPLTAIFLGLALAIEDVVSWVNGDKSITGAFLGPFTEWNEVVKDLVKNLKAAEEVLQQLMTIQGWKDLIKGVGITASESFDSVKGMKPVGADERAKWDAVGADNSSKNWEMIKGIFGAAKPDVTININGNGKSDHAVAKEAVDQMNSNTSYQQPVGQKK